MSRQGRHGEALFSMLCQNPEAKTEAVVNKASDDEHGWDHVVDIIPPKELSLPADLQDHLIQSFAQIKTTRGSHPSTQVKLSNALKSAKSPNPSFVFLFHHETENSPPKLYGKHIWRSEIEKFLMRGRKASVLNPPKALHDVKLRISFNAEDQIESHPSDWMMDKIKAEGGANYAKNKLDLVASVGYGEFPYEGKFKIPESATFEDIVLHELGLIKDLAVTEFTMFDNRFGIKSTVSKPLIGEARIELPAKGQPVILKLISNDMKEFNISAELKLPSLVTLENEEYRFLIDAGCFYIIVHPKGNNHTLNFLLDPNTKGRLDQKIGLLTYLSWSSLASTTIELHSEEAKFLVALANKSDTSAPWINNFSKVGRHIIDLLGFEKSKTIQLSYFDLTQSSKDMILGSSIIEEKSLKLELTPAGGLDEFSHLLGFGFTKIQDWCVGALYQIEFKTIDQIGDTYAINLRNPTIAKRFTFKTDKDKFAELMQSEFEQFRQSFETPTAVVMNGNFIEWSRAMRNKTGITVEIS